MGDGCKYTYYDSNGNVSEEYLKNQAAYGPEVARAMFITDAFKQDIVKLKFSTAEEVIDQLKTKIDHSILTGQGYIGPTKLIASTKNKSFDETTMINNMALSLKMKDAQMEKWDDAVAYFKYDKDNKKALENESEFEAYKKDARSLDEFRKTRGTAVHKFIEILLQTRLDAPADMKFKTKTLISEGIKNYKNKVGPSDPNRLPEEALGSMREMMEIVFKKVEQLVPKGQKNDYEIYPEVSLFSDDVLYDNAPLQGHVDMLVYSPSSNTGYIIDTKTVTEGSNKAIDFDISHGRKSGMFDHILDSSKNDASIQTSVYALLAKKKLGINILGSSVLVLPVQEYATNDQPGNKKWKMTYVKTANLSLQDLDSFEGELYNILDIKGENKLGEKNYESIIDDLFHGKLVTVTSSKDNFINKFLSRAVKTDDGKLQWNHPYDRTIKIVKNTEAELKEEIGKVYDAYIIRKRRAARDLVELFEKDSFAHDSVWNNPIMKTKAATILRRFPKSTYKVESASNIKGIGDDVLIFTNKNTGDVSLVSITMTYNEDYYFNDDTDETARTTIYGPFLDDETVQLKHGAGKIPKATTQTLNQLKLVLLASELKLTNPAKYANISDLLSTCLLEEDSDQTYDYAEIDDVRGHIRHIHAMMAKNGQTIPGEFTTLSESQSLNAPFAFEVDYFDIFLNKIQQEMDPLSQYFREHPGTPKKKSLVDDLKKSVNEYITDKYNLNLYPKLTMQMTKYMEALYSRLLLELKTPARVYEDQRYITANRAFLSFKNLMVAEDPTFRGHVLGEINSLTTIGNRTAEKVHIIISQYEQQAREKIVELVQEHDRLQTALMKNTPGVNLLVSIFHPNNFKKVFGPMLEDNFEFKEGDVENWMKFKDPSKLSGVQKEYVEFYNRVVKESFTTLFGSTKADLMLHNPENKDVVKKWKDGYIPILPKAASVDLKNVANMRQGMEASLEMIKHLFSSSKKSTMADKSSSLNPWEYSSFFPDQLDNSVGRGSKKTRHFLNITEDNRVISNKRSIELNPAVILNTLIVEAARKEHMSAASFAAHAIQAELAYKQMYAGVETGPLRAIIEAIVNLRIHGKVKDQGKFGQWVDSLKHITSVAMFFGSIRQFFTESTTATFQLSSQSLANFINKHFFKGDNSYNNNDMLWATKHFGSALGDQIVNLTGMYNSGLVEFTSDDYIATKKNSAFQTKHGFYLIQLTLKQAVQSVALAQMHKLGITEECFVRDEHGVYRYDETKDTNRFYVYDPDTKIEGQKTEAPTSEEDKQKWKLWKAHRLQLAKEGGINPKTNKMTRPFIVEELQSIKNQAVRLLGAMDSSEALAMEFAAIGRVVGAYKKWIRQKVANYWTPKNKSFKMGKWKEVGDELKFIEEDFEGILNSLHGIYKEIRAIGFSAAFKGMTDIQKRNMAKLTGDLVIFAIVAMMLSLIGDLLEDSLVGRELSKALTNATSDIFPAYAISNTITGSPAASVSIALNTVKNAKRVILYAATGDFDQTMLAVDKTMDVFGAYRSTKSIAEILTTYEPQK